MGKPELSINKKWISKIGDILPRMKWSLPPIKIVEWLENFEDNDREQAYDFLLALEYISFVELQYRLDDLLRQVVTDIGPGKILIIPYGAFGKSGTLISYPIRNTDAFKKLKKNVKLTFDFKAETPAEGTSLVMIDDFIGTGDTFIKAYQKDIKAWADKQRIKKRYLLSALIMKKGYERIKTALPSGEIEIFAETRNSIFDRQKSPFIIYCSLVKNFKLNEKYGRRINSFRDAPHSRPLGYGDSGAMIAFAHGTPNNTLPIIWSEGSWKPIFPRRAFKRMDEARKLKRNIAFYIGIMNRLGLDLYSSTNIKLHGKRVRKYNSKTDHSLLLVLKMKLDGLDEVIIAQTLGITWHELQRIYQEGKRKRYLDKKNSITKDGIDFFKRLVRTVRTHSFRPPTEKNLELKNTMYIPKTFKGKT